LSLTFFEFWKNQDCFSLTVLAYTLNPLIGGVTSGSSAAISFRSTGVSAFSLFFSFSYALLDFVGFSSIPVDILSVIPCSE
jgi:hypothetical protein